MRRYLFAALSIALVSVIMAIAVLSGLYGANPLKMEIVSQSRIATSIADRAAAIAAIATVSVAISTVLALIVGTIAVIAVIISNSSEAKTIEQLKVDIASLISTLLTLLNRSILYTNTSALDSRDDLFLNERNELLRIVIGPTGFALFVASTGKKENERSLDGVFHSLMGLIDLTTLSFTTGVQNILNSIAIRSNDILIELKEIDKQMYQNMRKALDNIESAAPRAADALEDYQITRLISQMKGGINKSYRTPTPAEVNLLADLANEKIGGEASDVVRHFADAAATGSDEDRKRFHDLIRQTLHIDDLDELTKPREAPV